MNICKQHSFLRHSLGCGASQCERKTASCELVDLTGVGLEDKETADSACFFPFTKPVVFIHNPTIALLQRIKVSAKPHPANT